MEPVWLGLAAPSILSSAGNLARAATRPFAAALERAAGLLEDSRAGESASIEDFQIDEARTRAKELGADLHGRIREMLHDAGITLDEPLVLRISPIDGQLEVVSDSPRRSVIEATLANDSGMAEDVRKLLALHELIAAADGEQHELLPTLTESELKFH